MGNLEGSKTTVPEGWESLQEMLHILRERIMDISNTPIMKFDDPVQAVHVLSAVSDMFPDLQIRELGSKVCVFHDVRRHLCQLLSVFLDSDPASAKREVVLRGVGDLRWVEDLRDRGHRALGVMTACAKAYESGISAKP
jgi:hypothetical protein